MRWLLPDDDLPVVPIYVNTQVPPAPSGRRCYAFGRALADILDECDVRVALFASGGLSHDHTGPRGGWIDEPMDRWVLDQLRRGKAERVQPMFDVVSDTLARGGAQIRLWLMVAAAMESRGARAQVIDYLPAYHIAAGVGFACWPRPSAL
jgi:protocatechuate 4,5-dioxygenase beta chain